MSHFRSAALRALALAAASAAFGAPGAQAAPPTIESLDTAVTANPPPASGACPKVMVVVARGTDEPGNQSPGLDGKYWTAPWYLGGSLVSGPDSPGGIWYRIAKELYYPATAGEQPMLTQKSEILRVDLTYPATTDFPTSVPMGTMNLLTYLENANANCGETKFVLLGYSQGALVIGNAIGVPSKRIPWFSGSYGTRAMNSTTLNQIVAVSIQANPAFNPGHGRTTYYNSFVTSGYAKDTYAIDTIDMNDGNYDPAYFGVTPRDLTGYAVKAAPTTGQAAQLPWVVVPTLSEDVGIKVRDYCIARDYICQSGPLGNTQVHNDYWMDIPSKRTLAVHAIKRLRIAAGREAPYVMPY